MALQNIQSPPRAVSGVEDVSAVYRTCAITSGDTIERISRKESEPSSPLGATLPTRKLSPMS